MPYLHSSGEPNKITGLQLHLLCHGPFVTLRVTVVVEEYGVLACLDDVVPLVFVGVPMKKSRLGPRRSATEVNSGLGQSGLVSDMGYELETRRVERVFALFHVVRGYVASTNDVLQHIIAGGHGSATERKSLERRLPVRTCLAESECGLTEQTSR